MDSASPQGFIFGTASGGFKTPGRRDLALVVSEVPAATAGFFTSNLFKAAPVLAGMERIRERRTGRAILVNTGQANACTGEEGLANCRETLALIASALHLEEGEILPASTGVIGQHLLMDRWRAAVPELIRDLGRSSLKDVAEAIMTTDAFPKYAVERVALSGGEIILAGAAKGAGMICPNMATTLSLVLSDAAAAAGIWRRMLARAVRRTFNRVTVDGDTSTNDTLYGLANGASRVPVRGKAEERLVEEALDRLLGKLAYMLVQDGEGASKVLHIRVRGAAGARDAEKAARTVGHSQLVKTAMYGQDANWGRIVAALGRSGAAFSPAEVRVSLCGVELFRNERPVSPEADALLAKPLQERDLELDIVLGGGPGEYRLLASDLGHEYVDVNAGYRS
ncbi:MAG: bifunctional glutamate N-acetyltransferase/amino-acid acetyltransferase ArgJ [Desulfovibrio sp.]|jgi:glutamate N-acetyltransferase/amino-acid N-acetyltransferase|nr:bifunctional glutamate N-acetyltransferase/amino-acid acetyltransferase ArgJ [Desulfovibrio sp.]